MNLSDKFWTETGLSLYRRDLPGLNENDWEKINHDLIQFLSREAQSHGGKVCSDKQAFRLTGTRRLLQIDNGSLGYTIDFDHKNRISFSRVVKVVYHSSKGGRIYEFLDLDTATRYFFTSHYFDRARERLFKNSSTRTETIDSVFVDMFREGFMLHRGQGIEVQVFTNWGLSLGMGISAVSSGSPSEKPDHTRFLEPGYEHLINALFFVTFVDNSMLNVSQLRILECAERIGPIDLFQSNKSWKSEFRERVVEFRGQKRLKKRKTG